MFALKAEKNMSIRLQNNKMQRNYLKKINSQHTLHLIASKASRTFCKLAFAAPICQKRKRKTAHHWQQHIMANTIAQHVWSSTNLQKHSDHGEAIRLAGSVAKAGIFGVPVHQVELETQGTCLLLSK